MERRATSKRVYVGNLAWSTTEVDLRRTLEVDGRTVASVQIKVDRDSGRSRGFAFVDLASEDEAHSAVTALNGMELGGRKIKVSIAKDLRAASGGFGRTPYAGGGDRDRGEYGERGEYGGGYGGRRPSGGRRY
jgi:RNA recognition motif-containing protein